MFDFSVIHEPVASTQREAVRQTVLRATKDGSFTYTEVLMAPEPIRTMALEILDGISSQNGIPQSVGNALDVGPVRLICVDPKGVIKIARWGNRNIYGTTIEAAPQKFVESYGNDAVVSDAYPERLARNVLRRDGWPSRNLSSRGANQGSIVELKWIEKRAKEPDAPPEVLEIYNQLLDRITAAQPPSANKSKSAGPAPAHP